MQSSVFDLSIMAATWVGGLLLGASPDTGVRNIVYLSLACFILATVVASLAKRTLASQDTP